MTCYESRDGRLRLFRGDTRLLHRITSERIGAIVTSPAVLVRADGIHALDQAGWRVTHRAHVERA
jgi:hypothetical protein